MKYGHKAEEKADEDEDEDNESDEDEDEDEDNEDEGDKTDDDKTSDEDGDKDVSKFIEDTGLTVEEFQKLPEKAQERLVATAPTGDPVKDEAGEKAKDTLKLMRSDPQIRARLAEIEQPGNKFVADGLKEVSAADLSPESLDALAI